MRGSSQDSFGHKTASGRIIQRPFRVKAVDPFIGTAKANTKGVTRIEFSMSYKDRLYLFTLKGRGPLFELPSDVGSDFIAELQDERRESVKNSHGGTSWRWKDTGNNHGGDCLLMALAAMDASAFSRGDVKPDQDGAKVYELKA